MERKYHEFIERWDAPDASRCVTTKAQTWSTLRKYMNVDGKGRSVDPRITQEERRKAYQTAIGVYLSNFDEWTSMLLQ